MTGQSRSGALSADTSRLLQQMMADAKLTAFQKRTLTKVAQEGGAMPLHVHPDTSQPNLQQPKSVPNPFPKSTERYHAIRTKERIPSPERQQYRPKVLSDSAKEKEKLQKAMEKHGHERGDEEQTDLQAGPSVKTEELTEQQQLLLEVQERRDFLEAMSALGQGATHQRQIEHEIQLRLSKLAKLQNTSP